MAKAAFNMKKAFFFTGKCVLNLRKKLRNCYVWSVAVYGRTQLKPDGTR